MTTIVNTTNYFTNFPCVLSVFLDHDWWRNDDSAGLRGKGRPRRKKDSPKVSKISLQKGL